VEGSLATYSITKLRSNPGICLPYSQLLISIYGDDGLYGTCGPKEINFPFYFFLFFFFCEVERRGEHRGDIFTPEKHAAYRPAKLVPCSINSTEQNAEKPILL